MKQRLADELKSGPDQSGKNTAMQRQPHKHVPVPHMHLSVFTNELSVCSALPQNKPGNIRGRQVNLLLMRPAPRQTNHVAVFLLVGGAYISYPLC